MRYTVFFTTLFFLVQAASGQQKTFSNYYGTSDSDYGNVVVSTYDGGYALINQTQLGLFLLPVLIKTDCNGNIEWTKGFRMPSDMSPLTNCFNLVKRGNQGYILLLGYSESGTGNFMTLVLLLDAWGNVEWAKPLPILVSQVSGSVSAEAGSFVVCGNPNNTIGSMGTTAMVRYDYSGNILDANIIMLPGSPAAITHMANGNFAIAGTFPSAALPSFYDVSVTVVDPEFNVLRSVVYDTFYDDEPYGITSDANNNIYVCGRSYFVASNWDAMLLKFDQDLGQAFVKYYDAGTSEGEVFRNIISTSDNDVVVCGDIGAFEERDPIITKINSDGMVLFSNKYPVSPLFTNYFFSIDHAIDGGFVATGDIRPPFSFRDAPIFKTDGAGQDGCFAESFSFSVNQPLYTRIEDSIFAAPYSPVTDFTNPIEENVAIHQVQQCNEERPCPGFDFVAFANCPDKCVHFYDRSIAGTSWLWEFEGASPSTSTLKNPENICYDKKGTYTAKLTVSNAGGSSVLIKEVTIDAECHPVFPNILTPDLNGVNEEYIIGTLPKTYHLQIFDRWGIQVADITENDKPWRGRNKKGERVSQGVYYYTFVDLVTGNEYNGFIHVSY